MPDAREPAGPDDDPGAGACQREPAGLKRAAPDGPAAPGDPGDGDEDLRMQRRGYERA